MANEDLDIFLKAEIGCKDVVKARIGFKHFFKSLFDKNLKVKLPEFKNYVIKIDDKVSVGKKIRLKEQGFEDKFGNKGNIYIELYEKEEKPFIEKFKEILKNVFSYTVIALVLLLVFYPVSEFILWILSHGFPKLWPNVFDANWITNFAVKYLPYAYHPNCGGFIHFIINVACFVAAVLLFEGKKIYFGAAIGAMLLYSMVEPAFFDSIINVIRMIIVIGIGILILMAIAAGGNSSSGSSSSGYKETNKSHEDDNRISTKSNNYSKSYSSQPAQSQRENINNISRKPKKPEERLIAYTKPNGKNVYVYDERGNVLFFKFGKEHGYTSKTVTVRRDDFLYVYNNKGQQIDMRRLT